MKRVEADISLVELKRVDLADDQIGPICYNVAVHPYLHFAVVAPRRVESGHHLVAVPAVALRQEVGQRLEIREVRRSCLPRETVSIRVPVVAPLLVLIRRVGVVVQPARRSFVSQRSEEHTSELQSLTN